MAKLVSNRLDTQSMPECFIFPSEKRPGKLAVCSSETIPVIDLGGATDGRNRTQIIQQIIKAGQEFGFFQVINHGVSSETIHNVLGVAKEFFEMPIEDKASLYSEDRKQACRLSTSINYDKEEVHYWRDNLKHPCHPVEEFMKLWPEKPTKYREVVGVFSVEVRNLGLRLLDLLCEGLGLEVGYFSDELSKAQLFSINHYPRCPDPSLTLGLPKHSDPNIITLLLQEGDVKGLQVFKDEQWIAVDPLPNAFVVNLGHQLQIISNGSLKSAEHRVVTNSSMSRTTIANFIYPHVDCLIEPAKPLVESSTGPLYRAFQFKEFLSNYLAKIDDSEEVLKPFKVQTCLTQNCTLSSGD